MLFFSRYLWACCLGFSSGLQYGSSCPSSRSSCKSGVSYRVSYGGPPLRLDGCSTPIQACLTPHMIDQVMNLYPHVVLRCSRRLWARVWQNIAFISLCVVGAVVFFIAATVVLSLIPLYLARRAVAIETISKFDPLLTLLILSHRIAHLAVAKGPYPLQYQASGVSIDSLAGIDLNSLSTEVMLSCHTIGRGI